MWPKVLMQLVELLPHVTRLVPMVDRFFASKVASEKANEAALAAMAEGVRGDLGQVTAAHAGLYRQLQDQSAQIAEVATDVRQVRRTIESQAERLAALEKQVAMVKLWVQVGIGLLVVGFGVVIALLVRAH